MSEPEIKLSNYPEIEKEWLIFEHLIKPGYFQSSSWQKLWHEMAAKAGYVPKVLTISNHNQYDLMSSFVIGSVKILKIFPRACAFLNETGSPCLDVICAEGSQPLIRENSPRQTLAQFFGHLVDVCKVKEIVIKAVPTHLVTSFQEACLNCGLGLIEEQRTAHYWINLETMRSANQNHLATLTTRTRGIIKKSIENYQKKYGELKIQYASSVEQAKQWLDELIKLNVARLDTKDIHSSFSFPFLKEFHFKLIEGAFFKNEIIMVQISAGTAILGYIYGFLHNEVIYIYQTGFDFELEKKSSPGLVSHHLLAQDALERGISRYDFLAGDYQYKKSLSNEHNQLVWLRLRKPSLLLSLDQSLRKLKRKLIKYR